MRQKLATAAEKLFFYTDIFAMEAERFGQWTIIPYQFPKSMWIAGNLNANEQFFAELSGVPSPRFPVKPLHSSDATAHETDP